MATWEDLATENLRAAKFLHKELRFRSAVSRAYYAAFAAITLRAADRGVVFPHGGNNPTHDQLPTIALNNLDLPLHSRREVAAIIRRLRWARVSADYIPADEVDERLSRDCLRDVVRQLELLEVSDAEPT